MSGLLCRQVDLWVCQFDEEVVRDKPPFGQSENLLVFDAQFNILRHIVDTFEKRMRASPGTKEPETLTGYYDAVIKEDVVFLKVNLTTNFLVIQSFLRFSEVVPLCLTNSKVLLKTA